MLQVIEVVLTGAEIKKQSSNVPENIQVKLDLKDVKTVGDDSVELGFVYGVDYLPDRASLKIYGRAYCRDNPKNVAKLVSEFQQKGKLSPELSTDAINAIGANLGLNSIFLLRPFGMTPYFLPPPIVPPQSVVPSKESKAKK